MDSIIDFVTLAIILHQELFIWYIQIKSGFKSKFISNGRRIAFDCTSAMVIIFLEMSSIHTDKYKNSFLVLGEGPADDINDRVGTAQKTFVLTLLKHIGNFI